MSAVIGNGVHRKNHYVAMLDCLHENTYEIGEPNPDDIVWCGKCYGYQTVMHVAGKFTVRCQNCRFSRQYGGELTARVKADSHAIRCLGHTVTLTLPDGTMETKRHEPQSFDFPNF